MITRSDRRSDRSARPVAPTVVSCKHPIRLQIVYVRTYTVDLFVVLEVIQVTKRCVCNETCVVGLGGLFNDL